MRENCFEKDLFAGGKHIFLFCIDNSSLFGGRFVCRCRAMWPDWTEWTYKPDMISNEEFLSAVM